MLRKARSGCFLALTRLTIAVEQKPVIGHQLKSVDMKQESHLKTCRAVCPEEQRWFKRWYNDWVSHVTFRFRRKLQSGRRPTDRWTGWPPTASWWCTLVTALHRTPNRECGGRSPSVETSSPCERPARHSSGEKWWDNLHPSIIGIYFSKGSIFRFFWPLRFSVGSKLSIYNCCLWRVLFTAMSNLRGKRLANVQTNSD